MLDALVNKIRPDLKDRTGLNRTAQVMNVYFVFYSIPLLIVGVIWLIVWSEWTIFRDNIFLIVLLFGITLLFQRYSFNLQFQIRQGVFVTSGGTFDFLVALSAVLIFGPTGYWLSFMSDLVRYGVDYRKNKGVDSRWELSATTLLGSASGLLSILLGSWFYRLLNGSIPLPDLTWPNLLPAILLLISFWLLPFVFSMPLFIALSRMPGLLTEESITFNQLALGIVLSSSLPNLGIPFTLLAAVLYSQNNVGLFLFFLAGVLLASVLSSKLSENVQHRTNRAREMSALEELGRAILVSEPNIGALKQVLQQHVNGMFFQGQSHIWLHGEGVLYESNHFDDPNISEIKTKLLASTSEYLLTDPFESALDGRRVGIALPIKSEASMIVGGISFNVPSGAEALEVFIPSLQALASQISSALYRHSAYEKAILNERMESELKIAGQIQNNFLPGEIPDISGYQISASLTPARQTSGDFYDFISLPKNKLGILIADVADKGAGAALFMALTRTLIRSFALEHPDEPEKVIRLANQRILVDTQVALFVTGFYAVLDMDENTLTYVNAGHNPPYLLFNGSTEPLTRTGIPLGIFEDQEWENKVVQLRSGEALVSFTDGITEAQNHEGEEFGEERLENLLVANQLRTVDEIQAQILSSVESFVDGAPQGDDLTIIVLKRE